MDFKLISKYIPSGDQPQAIEKMVNNLNNNYQYQVLLGATGTGKTFTIANVIEKLINLLSLLFTIKHLPVNFIRN